MERPQQYKFHQGDRVLPFDRAEYDLRIGGLRAIMDAMGVEAVVFTSMHNIAYYSGFLYCSFGRPYALVVTASEDVTISAGIDAGQPWRRCHGDNITYTDWTRDNYWRAILSVTGEGRVIGHEADHLTLMQAEKLKAFLAPSKLVDIAPATMRQRMMKSPAEIALITHGANVADVGGYAIREAVQQGAREIDVAMAGRDAMELEIAKRFPEAEYRDTWVWFQSGINTDGAHNPVTARALAVGDILSLNTFPMISGYYTALERTMFLREVDAASLRIWEANVAAHELGMSLLRPGARCSEVTAKINDHFRRINRLGDLRKDIIGDLANRRNGREGNQHAEFIDFAGEARPQDDRLHAVLKEDIRLLLADARDRRTFACIYRRDHAARVRSSAGDRNENRGERAQTEKLAKMHDEPLIQVEKAISCIGRI